MASRVSGALLKAIGLDELICHSRDHYVDTVVRLCETGAGHLPRLKQTLKDNMYVRR